MTEIDTADIDSVTQKLMTALKDKKIKISTAESCTGGLISKTITDYAGSSSVFERGFVTYCNQAKIEMLGVAKELFQRKGAVSQEVAEEMASGAVKNSHAQIAVSCTGIAGPGGSTPEKPVGLVYIGVSYNGITHATKHNFDGDRGSVRQQTLYQALQIVLKTINDN